MVSVKSAQAAAKRRLGQQGVVEGRGQSRGWSTQVAQAASGGLPRQGQCSQGVSMEGHYVNRWTTLPAWIALAHQGGCRGRLINPLLLLQAPVVATLAAG